MILKTIADNPPEKFSALAILGPTAVGKTQLSLQVAQKLRGEIISADSRQFFRGMDIGTAKAIEAERNQIPHHFIDFLDITEPFTAGQFASEAKKCMDAISAKGKLPIITGGSGLYTQALLYGLDDIPSDSVIREKFNNLYREKGLQALLQQLKSVDPEYYHSVDIQNPVRLIRGLEVFEITGKPYSAWRSGTTSKPLEGLLQIGLHLPREILYQRINQRVDQMMEQGLLEEVQALAEYRHCQALNTIGYSELFEYLEGKISLTEAVELIKRNTRRYAKRQLTWLRKSTDIYWFKASRSQRILEFIEVCFPERVK